MFGILAQILTAYLYGLSVSLTNLNILLSIKSMQLPPSSVGIDSNLHLLHTHLLSCFQLYLLLCQESHHELQ